MGFKDIKKSLFGEEGTSNQESLVKEHSNLGTNIPVMNRNVITPNLPSGRTSKPEYSNTLGLINKTLEIIKAEHSFDLIPVIRKLAKVNPDMSQALQDLTQLANTGHLIKFDPGVSPELQDQMREELDIASKAWGTGLAGVNGIVNKMISQLLIGGAISNEWVPNKQLDGIDNLVFVNPENIRFAFNKSAGRYDIYQNINNGIILQGKVLGHVKLNPNTFKYYGLNGDTDLPYGTPPYLAALDPLATQRFMIDNIKFIVETMGILGYLDVKIAKPDMQDNESEEAYTGRLELLLDQLKTRAAQGFRDGINVGFKDDHEFDFKSTTKGVTGVESIFNQNELQVSSGLKYDAAFSGRGAGSETMTTILFTKMLSQLTNIHNIIIENLKFGYTLHLRLKGFKFKYLDVEFNKSTITDDLKYNQAREIKQRVLRVLYADGIISQEQYADEMGYKKPDKKEPRVPIDPAAITKGVVSKTNRKDGKDRSARSSRDKQKPQGTISDRSKKL